MFKNFGKNFTFVVNVRVNYVSIIVVLLVSNFFCSFLLQKFVKSKNPLKVDKFPSVLNFILETKHVKSYYHFVFQLFEYQRLVEILLHIVSDMEQEGFVQRIGIYLLNSLACQVDGTQKQLLGDLGAMDVIKFCNLLVVIYNCIWCRGC
jgi:hypothetical protein